jgi:hypothetical protein
MTMTYRTLVTIFLFLGACSVGAVQTGGDDDGGGVDAGADNPANVASFNATIAPLVTECTACHSTTQPPNLSSFSALQAIYKTKPGSTNKLVTKAVGLVPEGVHQGIPYLTADELTTVTNWVDGLQ